MRYSIIMDYAPIYVPFGTRLQESDDLKVAFDVPLLGREGRVTKAHYRFVGPKSTTDWVKVRTGEDRKQMWEGLTQIAIAPPDVQAAAASVRESILNLGLLDRAVAQPGILGIGVFVAHNRGGGEDLRHLFDPTRRRGLDVVISGGPFRDAPRGPAASTALESPAPLPLFTPRRGGIGAGRRSKPAKPPKAGAKRRR